MKLRPVLFMLACAAVAPALPAQDVQVRGGDRTRAAQIAREVLARGNYLRFDRDTILPATFRAPGDLVVVDADVRLAGQVAGSAVVLGGHLFLRPGSKVAGSIAVIDGGVYPSGRAEYGTIFESNPSTRVAVAVDGDSGLVASLEGPSGPAFVSYGLHATPTYDRVNGVTASVGATLNPFRREGGPGLGAWVSYRERNPDQLGGGLRLDVPVAGGVRLVAEGSRATRTNDAWARPDLSNSLAAALVGLDYRDYYDADRLSLFVARPLRTPLIAGESWFGPRVGVQAEEARSLSTQDPPSLFGELDRANPAVVDGQINSVIAGGELHWVGRLSRVMLDAQVEHGRLLNGHLLEDSPDMDRDFTRLLAFGSYSTIAFRTHQVRYAGRVMLPLAGTEAPPQRYGILGGASTIPTLDIAEMRGDHLVFTEGSYAIPFPRVMLPMLGIPSLELRHLVGAAWVEGAEPDWVQNVGVGIVFPLAGIRLVTDLADTDRTRVLFTVSALRI